MDYNSNEWKQAINEMLERMKMEEEDNPHIDEYGFCKHCKWNSAYPVSHIDYLGRNGECKYIDSKYNVFITEDGKVGFTKK